MKDYIAREKLRIRAYNAMVDYISSLIRYNYPDDFDRIIDFSQSNDDNNWITAKWRNHNGKLMITNLPFTIINKTQLLTDTEANKATNVNLYSLMTTTSTYDSNQHTISTTVNPDKPDKSEQITNNAGTCTHNANNNTTSTTMSTAYTTSNHQKNNTASNVNTNSDVNASSVSSSQSVANAMLRVHNASIK